LIENATKKLKILRRVSEDNKTKGNILDFELTVVFRVVGS